MNAQISTHSSHPVWDVYDLLRTARYNSIYFEEKLYLLELSNKLAQVILAAAVPSSAIAGLKIWDFGLGQFAWEIFTGVAAVIAFSLPFLGLTEKIKKVDALVVGYTDLFYDIDAIRVAINDSRTYSDSHKRRLLAAMKQRARLAGKEKGMSINKNLAKKCRGAVLAELPAEKFFVPDSIK